MENTKIIICDCDHKDVNPEQAVFEAAGEEFKWLHCKTKEEVIEQCKGAVCILNQYTRMDKDVFKAIPTLKMIVRYGVGVDNVNLADATEAGIQVCNVPDYGTNEVADQAIALMLSLTRKTFMIGNMTKAGFWNCQEAIPLRRLSTLTVGIIGTGRIGIAFAKRASAFGCKLIAYDACYGENGRDFPDFIEYKGSVDEVLREADILSLHCGLNESNRDMMNANAFSKMKDGAYFINVSRGGLVDESDLDAAVSSGKIAGAGLDVAAVEPMPKDSPLFKHPNVIITPHMGWYSEESAIELKRKCAEEAVRFMRGEPLHYPVNRL